MPIRSVPRAGAYYRRSFTLAIWAGIAVGLAPLVIAATKDAEKPSPEKPAAEKKPALSINDSRAYQGYTLLTPMNSTSTYLIDMHGRVVKTWKSEYTPALCAYLLPNGHLLRPAAVRGGAFGGPGSGGRIQEFDWDGNLVWDFPISNAKNHPHHDICRLPTGNVLAICWDKKTPEEAIAAGRKPGTVRGQMQPDCILEIKPTGKTTGEVVWEWHVWDHLVQDFDKTKANYGEIVEHPELVDINYGEDVIAPMLNRPDDLAKLRSLGYVGGGSDPAKSADPEKKPGDDKSNRVGDKGKGADDKPKPDSDRLMTGDAKPGDVKSSDAKSGDAKPTGNSPDAAPPGDPRRSAQGGPGGPGGPGPGGPGGMNSDWTHTNCVSYNEELDQIMLSIHNFSEVWIIDHSTTTQESASHSGGRRGKGGDLLYRWGNPLAYRNGTKADQRLYAQHAAHWIAPGLAGAGHMLVFNNGNHRPDGEYSTVDEVVLPLTKDGLYQRESYLAYGPERAEWSYAAPDKASFYSMLISNAQRLPNGNTLICSGNNGIVFEVTPAKETVWRYTNPGQGGMGPMGFGGPMGGLLMPSFLQDMLQLTDKQKQTLGEMQKLVNEKLDEILTDDQRKQLKQPFSFAGAGGPPRGNADGSGNPPPGGRANFMPPRSGEIMPARVAEQLKLTDQQTKRIADLQKEVDPQFEKFLTKEQHKQLDDTANSFGRGPGFGPQGFGPPGPRTPNGDPAKDAGPPGDAGSPKDAAPPTNAGPAKDASPAKEPAAPKDTASSKDAGPPKEAGDPRRPDGAAGAPQGDSRGRGGPGGPGGLFRGYRYGADYAGLAGKDLKPGDLLENVIKSEKK